MEELKRRRGRPLVGPARNNQIRIRLTDEEVNDLRMASEKYGMSISDIVRNGARTQLNLLKYRGN